MGSKYGGDSIFNRYGSYGSKYSSSSPWNKYTASNSVPVLIDDRGAFYGYFTINIHRADAIDFAKELKDIFEHANEDLDLVQEILCEIFK